MKPHHEDYSLNNEAHRHVTFEEEILLENEEHVTIRENKHMKTLICKRIAIVIQCGRLSEVTIVTNKEAISPTMVRTMRTRFG